MNPPPETTGVERLAGLATANAGFVTIRQANEAGLTDSQIRTLVRRGEWEPVRRGLRRVAGATTDQRLDRIRASLIVAGKDAVLAGHSAAELRGIVGSPPTGPLWIAVPPDRHPQHRAGIRLLRTIVAPEEIDHFDSIPVTSPLRTVLDSARHGDRLAAVCLLESALRLELVATPDLRAALTCIEGQSGARRATTALNLVDVRSESPLETRARLLIVDAGLPYPQLQHPVRPDDKRRIDLAYVAPARSAYSGLAIEIDGRDTHARAEAFDSDPGGRPRSRRRAGWCVGSPQRTSVTPSTSSGPFVGRSNELASAPIDRFRRSRRPR